jgi:hypothetical protein
MMTQAPLKDRISAAALAQHGALQVFLAAATLGVADDIDRERLRAVATYEALLDVLAEGVSQHMRA